MQSVFHVIFEKDAEICFQNKFETKLPRHCNVKAHVVGYYKIAFYILLHTFKTQHKNRFSEHKWIFKSFGQLVPKQELNLKKCAYLYKFYEEILEC